MSQQKSTNIYIHQTLHEVAMEQLGLPVDAAVMPSNGQPWNGWLIYDDGYKEFQVGLYWDYVYEELLGAIRLLHQDPPKFRRKDIMAVIRSLLNVYNYIAEQWEETVDDR